VTIESLANEAQRIEPSLQGVDEWLGEIFVRESQTLFLVGRHFFSHQWADDLSQQTPLAIKGLKRYEAAIANRQAEAKGIVALRIAEAHALIGDSPPEIARWLTKANDYVAHLFFQEAEALAILSTCQRKREAGKLLASLGFAEMMQEQVRQHVLAEPQASYLVRFVVFANAPWSLPNPPYNPTILTIRRHDTWDSAFAEWESRVVGLGPIVKGGIPDFTYDAASNSQRNPEFQPLDAILAQCFAQFTFVMPSHI
jgi:hypothetical protein